jgi:hypothetical protein
MRLAAYMPDTIFYSKGFSLTDTVSQNRRTCQKLHIYIYFEIIRLVAHPARLERAACGFEVRRSIQLSYGCAP